MTRFERFLDDLDGHWPDSLPDRMTFRVIGSTALFFQTTYERGTRDGDVLRAARDGFDDAICATLEALAGRDSVLSNRHGIYLDLVRQCLPFLPEQPVWHGLPDRREHIDLRVLDVVDVCVAKLKRWKGSDRQDVSEMIDRGALVHERLVERFRSMARRHAFDARSEELLPMMISRLHEVERDLFAIDKLTVIPLPEWIAD